MSHDLQAAAAKTPEERARAILALTEDLRRELFRAAQQGQPAELDVLAALYRQSLACGLAESVRQTPAERRAALEAEMSAALDQARREAQGLARRLPAQAAAPVTLAGEAAGSAAMRWREQPVPLLPPIDVSRPETMLAVLVSRSAALGPDADAVARTAHCTDLADQLAASIVSASERGETEWADRLSQQLPAVTERAAFQLHEASQAELSDARRAELTRVAERFAASAESLEQKLLQLPAPARAGLQRALEASRRGRETAEQAMRGGPPAHAKAASKSDKAGFVPPGLQKGLGRKGGEDDEDRREAEREARERAREKADD